MVITCKNTLEALFSFIDTTVHDKLKERALMSGNSSSCRQSYTLKTSHADRPLICENEDKLNSLYKFEFVGILACNSSCYLFKYPSLLSCTYCSVRWKKVNADKRKKIFGDIVEEKGEMEI